MALLTKVQLWVLLFLNFIFSYCRTAKFAMSHRDSIERLQIAIIPAFMVKVGFSYALELVSPLYKTQFISSSMSSWPPEIHRCFADHTY